jgi:hypothetical protein
MGWPDPAGVPGGAHVGDGWNCGQELTSLPSCALALPSGSGRQAATVTTRTNALPTSTAERAHLDAPRRRLPAANPAAPPMPIPPIVPTHLASDGPDMLPTVPWRRVQVAPRLAIAVGGPPAARHAAMLGQAAGSTTSTDQTVRSVGSEEAEPKS